MRPILYLLIAAFSYACANFLLKHYLSHLSKPLLMLCYSAVILTLVFTVVVGNKNIKFSSLQEFSGCVIALAIIGFSISLASGDFFYFSAYEFENITTTVGTSVYVMIPVFAGVLEWFKERKLPSLLETVGCIFAILAVVCMTVGKGK
jgi:drug/metabolite transporter (DMT)-like permease